MYHSGLEVPVTTTASLEEMNEATFRNEVARLLEQRANSSQTVINSTMVANVLNEALGRAGHGFRRDPTLVIFKRFHDDDGTLFFGFPTKVNRQEGLRHRLPDAVIKINAKVRDMQALTLLQNNLSARIDGLLMDDPLVATPALKLMLNASSGPSAATTRRTTSPSLWASSSTLAMRWAFSIPRSAFTTQTGRSLVLVPRA